MAAAAENNYPPPPPHSLQLQQAIQPPTTSSSSSLFLGSTPTADLSGDPGFGARAARFSSFGSRSFNGRTTANNPFVNNRSEFPPKPPVNPSSVVGGGGGKRKLQRVLSSPALKVNEAERKVKRFSGPDQLLGRLREDFPSSGEVERDGSGFGGGIITTDVVNPRKRRSSSGLPTNGNDNPASTTTTTTSSSSPANSSKGEDEGGNGNQPSGKRRRSTEPAGKAVEKTSEEEKGNEGSKKQSVGGGRGKEKSMPPSEPLKDYIHVRARRGQATDSHSLAERVRREKISERMKLLQDLVPGCNKVVGKAMMLEEIINYVQSLQRQVEFLSMKLATVNPSMEYDNNNSSPDQSYQKDIFQDKCSMQKQQQQQQANNPTQIMDYSIGQQQQQQQSIYCQSPHNHQQCNSNGISHSSRSTSGVAADQVLVHESIDSHSHGYIHGVGGLQLPFSDEPPLYLCESDLQTIVQMGLFSNVNGTTTPHDNNVEDDDHHDPFQSQSFHGLNQKSVANES